jgi:hypothetical protein
MYFNGVFCLCLQSQCLVNVCGDVVQTVYGAESSVSDVVPLSVQSTATSLKRSFRKPAEFAERRTCCAESNERRTAAAAAALDDCDGPQLDSICSCRITWAWLDG